jgi:hypothetical protein
LIPKSKEWKVPLVLSQHPEQAALMMLRVGKGYLIRSELPLEDSTRVMKTMIDGIGLEKLNVSWGNK